MQILIKRQEMKAAHRSIFKALFASPICTFPPFGRHVFARCHLGCSLGFAYEATTIGRATKTLLRILTINRKFKTD